MSKLVNLRVVTLGLLLAASAAAAAPGNTTCIRSYDILNTTRPDNNTILFEMRDHKIWKNTLLSICFGLHNEVAGFTYQPTDPGTDELCSNQVTIKLNTFGSFCQLGPFVRVR